MLTVNEGLRPAKAHESRLDRVFNRLRRDREVTFDPVNDTYRATTRRRDAKKSRPESGGLYS